MYITKSEKDQDKRKKNQEQSKFQVPKIANTN